jgi:hypothetical protein
MARTTQFLSAFAALTVVTAGAACAQTLDAQRVSAGFEANAADCEALRSAVFVEIGGKGICFRYFLSTQGGSAGKALVYLSGDAPSTVRYGSGRLTLEVEPAYEGPTPQQLDRFVGEVSSRAKAPAIFLARMGLDGSSGWHAHRRTYFEVMATNKALDLIKARHNFDGFHLAGQSGGGHLIGALLANRGDIGCAVPGSGLLMTEEHQLPPDRFPLEFSKLYNPASRALSIARQSKARLIVLTDGQDQVVPVEKQIGFVRRIAALGGQAKHIFVRAFDTEHHQLRRYALEASFACIAGASDDEIELRLFQFAAKLMEQKVAANAPKSAPVPPVSANTAAGAPGHR